MRLPYLETIQGRELHNYFGNRILESRTTGGRIVAVKQKPVGSFVRSEADMMDYASRQPGMLVPKVFGCYHVIPDVMAPVTELVPGTSLDQIWHTLSKNQQYAIKEQLKRTAQPYIGRINRQETYNFYDRLHFDFMGPFETEEEFDNWGLSRVKSPLAQKLWKKLLPRMRTTPPGEAQEFVLTHGDLAARNIMVHEGKLSEIVDWADSGFFPKYMEYALAIEIHDCHEKWWRPILKEILDPCGFQRAQFTAAIKDRGW